MQGKSACGRLNGAKMLKKGIVFIIAALLIYLLVQHVFFNNRFDSVVEGRIYRSAQLSGDDLTDIIKGKDIRSILNLRGRWEEHWYEKEKAISEKNNIRLYDVRISPHKLPDFHKLSSILDILVNSEKPLLIHCQRGVDRTGLVSAIALLMEKDPPLSRVKEQFSLRYGVLPVYRSVGPYFFKNYEQWLKKADKTHSRDNFLYWVDNEYVDSKGNLIYWVDAINDKVFSKKRVFMENDAEELYLRGWAFNLSKKSPADGDLYIVFDNQISQKAVFKRNRPDVARFFKLGEMYYENFVVGWEAEFKRDRLSDGCHKIYLKLVEDKSTVWNIATRFEFCLE